MNRNKEFAKNTIILFIGKFATQFMSLLLLPLFTHFLITSDYGYVDLLQTYISLFYPVLTLRLDSATFRFLIESRKDKEKQTKYISNIFSLLLVILLLTIGISIIIPLFIKIKYYYYIVINILVLMMTGVLMQFLRGLGKNKKYSIASIITGFTNLFINTLLIIKFHFGANSILISSIISNIICMIYIFFELKLWKHIRIKLNKDTTKELLSYSIPMIPNALSWWIINVSDRTIITTFINTAVNGIYTVSCKFSNILNSIFTIFNMSWQETTALHINDEDKDEFFSNMINGIVILFGMISLMIVGILPFVYNIVIGSDYLESYKYIPLLLYANVGNVFATLIGAIYLALKKTKEIATTTIISAIINIVVDLILIKFIGLYAAIISTIISNLYLCIYRFFDSKKYINLKLNIKKLLLFSIIYIISTLLYLYNNIYLNIFNILFILLFSYILNKRMIGIIKNKIYRKIKGV